MYGRNVGGGVFVGAQSAGGVGAALSAARRRARAQAALLHRMLPDNIIDRMGRGETIADEYPCVTVLFTDVVGFTEMSASTDSATVLSFLNAMFDTFDLLADAHGVYKARANRTTAQQRYSTTAQQRYSTTAQQRNSATAQQHNSTTAQQHNSTTTQQHYSATALQHNSTTAKLRTPCAETAQHKPNPTTRALAV